MKEEILREIANAYTWEGFAICKVEKTEGDRIFLDCWGSSIVEHIGDEQGIQSQVRELINQEFEDDNGKYRVISAKSKIHREEQFEDNDYQISVKGQIILMKL